MPTPRLRWALAPLAVALIAPSAASAAITPMRTDAQAYELAKAIADDPTVIDPATTTFETIAPVNPGDENFDPAGLSTTPLGTFPRSGDSYAILSTGDAKIAPNPNDAPSSGLGMGFNDIPGRGAGAHDVLVWKIGVNAPASANCLVVRFRFLSEEYPEFVNAHVNDAFVAELDKSTWLTNDDGSAVTAPDNFAYDEKGNPITVDATGAATATADNAAGTTYDGATRRLAAAKALTPGAHTLYLSIFDQGDDIYDSAVFVDDLRLISTDAGRCTSGAFQDDAAPTLSTGGVANPPEPLVGDGQFTQDDTPTFGGKAGTTLNDDPNITGTIYSAASVRATAVNGTAVQSKSVKVAGDGTWVMTADPLPEGSYVFQASQGSSNGQSTLTDPIHFSVDKTAPAPAFAPIGWSGRTRDSTPQLGGTAGTAAGDGASLTVRLYAGRTATGSPASVTVAQAVNGAWSAQLASLKDGTYTATVEQTDAAGHSGLATQTFAVTTANPIGKVNLARTLTRAKAAKGLKGRLAFAFPGKVTYALSAKVGGRTLKVGTVKRTLKTPGTASFTIKPSKKTAAAIRRKRGQLVLKIAFVDDQGRIYTKTQTVRVR